MKDDLLRVGTALYLTGQLVEQARARVIRLVEQGLKLSSAEVLEANAAFHLVSNRFLTLEAEFETLKGGQPDDQRCGSVDAAGGGCCPCHEGGGSEGVRTPSSRQ